jgi:alcohol dehydrogenase class IV
MKAFDYYQPTDIHFGVGRISEIGEIMAKFGKKTMVIVDPVVTQVLEEAYNKVIESIKNAGVEPVIFDKVVANPRLSDIHQGAELAQKEAVDSVLGFGGGSTMDTAKAVAVEATHEGSAWDYLFFKKEPTEKTLPIVAITTTSGTGSQVTKVSVLTNTEESCKSAICHPNVFPRACIVDPELMLTVPKGITASTGFDVFTHSFESYLNVNCSLYVELIALESIRLMVNNLKLVLDAPNNVKLRAKMAWADTLAGMSIANAGTTIPHALGQPISGHFPKVSHGQSLAVVYPAFLEFTKTSAVGKFAKVARIFNPDLENASDEEAADALKDELVAYLKDIGMYFTLEDFGMKKEDVEPVLKHAMEFPDSQVNPVAPTEEDMRSLYMQCFGN